MAEAERIEKKFKYGVEESDQTHFEQYAENWLKTAGTVLSRLPPTQGTNAIWILFTR